MKDKRTQKPDRAQPSCACLGCWTASHAMNPLRRIFQFRWQNHSLGLATMAALLLTSGCQAAEKGHAAGLHPKILLGLERGISQSRLESVLGVPARHEFTAVSGSVTNRCVSYYFAAYYLSYYFIFTNAALERISLPPRFEHELSPWEHGKRAVWKSYDAEERLAVVIGAPALQPDDIAASIEHRYRPAKFDNALPAAIIAAPIILAQSSKRATERREIEQLVQRFDPFCVELGMTLFDVERRYGTPRRTEKREDGSEIRYYGSSKLGVENRLLWVAVVFKNGKASEIFSDQFFDYRKIQEQR